MTLAERRVVARALRGLLKIAEMAMPDSFYATDPRVRRGHKLLADLQFQEERTPTRKTVVRPAETKE